MSQGSNISVEKKGSSIHMLGHGLSPETLPENQKHFISAADKSSDRKEKYDRDRLMLALLADAVLSTVNNIEHGEGIFDMINDFIDYIFNGKDSTEDKINHASSRYGTPSYSTFDKIDYSGAANFDQAVEFVLEREGYLSNDKFDRGGLTKYGISQKANPDIDVRNLTREDAIAIYKDRYWDAIGADGMDMATALVAFDSAVNHGVGNARKMLAQTNGDVGKMLDWRLDLYDNIVDRDASQGRFLNGWRNRIAHLSDAVENIYDRATGSAPAPALT